MERQRFDVDDARDLGVVQHRGAAGADRHLVADVSGLIAETDPMLAFQRLGEVCKYIKAG